MHHFTLIGHHHHTLSEEISLHRPTISGITFFAVTMLSETLLSFRYLLRKETSSNDTRMLISCDDIDADVSLNFTFADETGRTVQVDIPLCETVIPLRDAYTKHHGSFGGLRYS